MEILKELKSFLNNRIKENISLKEFTSFKTGGIAKIVVFPENKEEIEKIFSLCEKHKKKFLILGKGTNVLISDYGFEGIVIITSLLDRIKKDNNFLICQAGVKISSLLNFCIKNNLSGIEFLSGIPGTIGGAVITNAGLKKEWIGEKIKWVEVYNPEKNKFERIKKEEIEFSYRYSNLEKFFIISICLKLEIGEKEKILKKIKEFIDERKNKQPIEKHSAGSVFKNPEGKFAGKLIEDCGLKGFCIGDACISEKHANFIINKENAKSSEIYKLIELSRKKVKEKYGIELEPEIKIIGKF